MAKNPMEKLDRFFKVLERLEKMSEALQSKASTDIANDAANSLFAASDRLRSAAAILHNITKDFKIPENIGQPLRDLATAVSLLEGKLDQSTNAAGRLASIFANVQSLTPEKVETLGKTFDKLGLAFQRIDSEEVAEGTETIDAFAKMVAAIRDLRTETLLFDTKKFDEIATTLGRIGDAMRDLCPALLDLEECLPGAGSGAKASPIGFPGGESFSPLFNGHAAVDGHASGRLIPVDGRASEAGGLGTLVATFDGGAESVERLGETMGRFRQVSRDTLEEIDQVATATFRRLEDVLVGFAETGKFEWRDLARVALGAIGDIFAAQMKAAGAASSGGGGLFGAIGDILGGFLSFGGGGAPTPLQLSGPFQHGGSFVVGGSGAPDSRLVSFLATPGERVDVLTPAQQGAFGGAVPVVNITQNFDFKGASLEAVALLRREANRIKHEMMAEIISSAQRGGAFARMSRI